MDTADISMYRSINNEHYNDHNDSLLKFIASATLLLVGQSNSGKTSYMQKLVEMGDRLFTIAPSRYIWLYNIYQDLYDEVASSVPNVEFVQGLPTRADIERWAENERHLILIVVDLYHVMINSRDILDLFVLLCHHLTVTVIISCHNIFMNSKYENNDYKSALHSSVLTSKSPAAIYTRYAAFLSQSERKRSTLFKFMTTSWKPTDIAR